MEEMIDIAVKEKTNRTGPVLFSEYNRGEGIKTALDLSRDDIIFEIRESGLKGRGGAGFPTATKWMLTKNILFVMQMKVSLVHLKTAFF